MKNHLLFLLFISIIVFGCREDDEENNNPIGKYSTGTFIVNEGTFGLGDGSISYFNGDTLEHHIFSNTNFRPLGDVVQSLLFHNGKGFISVNNSNKIEVVDQGTFQELATVGGLELPRHLVVAGSQKAYVSEWGSDGISGKIKVLDMDSHMITDSINTGGGAPEKMRIIGDRIYVGHSGGFGVDSVVTIIDPFNNSIIQTLQTGLNPAEVIQDNNGHVWVLCQGYTDWSSGAVTNGRLMAFRPDDFSLVHDLELPGNYPSDLNINASGDKLYFLFNGNIMQHDVSLSFFTNDILVSGPAPNGFYSLSYNDIDGLIYVGDAKDYVSQGEIMIFDEAGISLDTFPSGILPTEVIFEYQ